MPSTSYDLSESGMPPRFALTQFTVDEFHKFWPQLEPLLDRVPHTWRRWTKDHIYQGVTADLLQMWGIGRPPQATLVLLTTINVYPTMRVLNIIWAAGTFEDDMLPLLDATLTGYARLNGCAEIEIVGRSGWEPKLRSLGFASEARVWSRKVQSIHVH